ncbi:H-type small acid-soluble spore protein [Salipaludibacillus agaradhaerens]|uniref:H-type small acid-soluble spore protein n=1 Tax=Salipaludibacillus agaradhaerens TaxID=76935 RepID=UPI002150C386|nr:H-type small acid-soluble spore protein [Salipaludibacillus agaradhaerens]MCR6108372.1 H-type small acid-soluble spore protein [Salipaludibacillus agaradhaerens]MCR6120395.1 H-type small acid-soluble spore protein [Salipaludibacillus agaradhaerens]UJW59405.1 H-type small acid-soluble spore protein [Bacillus sp. A116_S68]
MDKQRAEEIAHSPDMKHVTYNDIPVYIQHVNDVTDTARIFSLNQPENEFDVPVTSLMEKKNTTS